jgi:hypothetical protein
MEHAANCIKVKTKDGKLLMSLYPGKDVVVEHGVQRGATQAQVPNGTSGENGGNGKYHNGNGHGNGKSGGNGNGESMTFPQKKFLFRLLAEQGFEGDKAQDRLKELFKVNDLKEIGKTEASRMIERLLKETKGGE